MHIERGFQTLFVNVLQELLRIRKEQPVPTVSAPTHGVAGLIEGMLAGAAGTEGGVPVHVDDQDIEGHVILAKTAHQIVEFLIGVGPIARPPRAEGEARRQRDAPGDENVIAQRLLVIVTIAEEIPILTLAGRALHDPGPRTVLAVDEAEVVGVEERARGVVHQRPAIARDEAGLDGLLGFRAECAIERARGAHQVAGVGRTGMPCDFLAVQGEGDREICGRELAVAGVGQVQGVGVDVYCAGFVTGGAKLRYRQIAVQEYQRRVVFKLAVGGPLHADELRREDGEASVIDLDDGLGVGNGIVDAVLCM